MVDLYSNVRKIQTLANAWRVVKASAMQSSSVDIRNEASEFDAESHRYLRSIQTRLQKQTFKFKPQMGVAKLRVGKSPRPLVIAPIENRIVQRAILDVLQRDVPGVQAVLDTPTSFGGIRKRRVSMAIGALKNSFNDGGQFYLRSDIPNFFTLVNRSTIINYMRAQTDDEKFINLFEMSITTTLDNLTDLQCKNLQDLFPLGPEGVAQGSPLSPLIANIYMADFDREMNLSDLVCIRYIDDFVIVSRTEKATYRGFKIAKAILNKIGLSAYSPVTHPQKASQGEVIKGFEFLGCFINPTLTLPAISARKSLAEKVDAEIRRGLAIADTILDTNEFASAGCYAQTLNRINNIILGWGKAFSFCTGDQVFEALDVKLTQRLEYFHFEIQKRISRGDERAKRMIMGVRMLKGLNISNDVGD
ncbi:MAG: prophage putative reverse transcriptase/maturase [Pseudomonas sp.]|nr:prophage putative reverse transcriptase/maturase [Pseudomonas sp.]